MKIKQSPEDFRVEELTDVAPSSGPFALYRLDKTGLTTHDAIHTIRRLWKLSAVRMSYGGLKDRHAHTSQYLSIDNGPPRDLRQQGLALTYLGQVSEAYTSAHITANRFALVIRDLGEAECAQAVATLNEIRADGLANYFDDQRFGSVDAGGEFMARHMVLGNWETALQVALTAPYEFDRAPEKKVKATLRTHWGDWLACRAKLPKCHAATLVDFLIASRGDFRGAIGRMRLDLTGLYLSAYQSHLWNRFLARWLTKNLGENERVGVRLKLDVVPMPRWVSRDLSGLVLPLPSARLRYDEQVPARPPDWPDILSETLVDEKVDLEQLKLKGLRRPFFGRGERRLLMLPEQLAGLPAQDERHAGRNKLLLEFQLPRGGYATLLVKRLFG